MEDNNRSSNTSNGSNRRLTALVLLLAVGALAGAGVLGMVLLGRADTAAGHAVVTTPQSQANSPAGGTAGAGNADTQSTGGGAAPAGQAPDPGKSPDPKPTAKPGKPGKPPVIQFTPPPFPKLTPPPAKKP
jgi:hypothetical protein